MDYLAEAMRRKTWRDIQPSGEMSSYTPTFRERTTDWLRKKLFTDDRAGQQKAEQVSNVAEFTPYGLMTGMYDAGNQAGHGNLMQAGLMTAMAGIPGMRTRGGKVIDGTDTGWIFKDVLKPHGVMQKGDWAKVNRATDLKDWDVVDLPIGALNATQKSVNPDFSSAGQHGELPFVIKKDGQYFVQYGHHRLTAAAAKGLQTSKVRLVDLDGTTQTNFPLLDALK
jgi:uncharacterized ParB-like nuclease family protein